MGRATTSVKATINHDLSSEELPRLSIFVRPGKVFVVVLGQLQQLTLKLAVSIFYILIEEREKIALDQELSSCTHFKFYVRVSYRAIHAKS